MTGPQPQLLMSPNTAQTPLLGPDLLTLFHHPQQHEHAGPIVLRKMGM